MPREQPLHHAPELLHLRLQPIRLEREGPGAVDVRQHGERALGQQPLRQSRHDRVGDERQWLAVRAALVGVPVGQPPP